MGRSSLSRAVGRRPAYARSTSTTLLIQQLRELERDGIVERTVHEQVPPKVVYSLTPRGDALNAALEPLGEWGEANMEHILATRVA